MDPEASVVASSKGLLEEVRYAQQPEENINELVD